MTVLDSLPSRPLKRADIERLRAHDLVEGLIELVSHEHAVRNGGLERAVALVDRTVVDLSFDDGKWEQTVLARDADEREHLHVTLEQLGQD